MGSIALIELLLINGANPNVRDTDGRTPVHWSTASHCTKGLSLLLKVPMLYISAISVCAIGITVWS